MRGKKRIIGTDRPGYKDDPFIEFVCQRHRLERPIALYVWRAIKESMAFWFKNQQKPVDFEYFVIHPMPYRVNWKEIMLARHPDCVGHFLKPRKEWLEALNSSGFIQDLGNEALIALEWPGIVVWGLEVRLHNHMVKEFIDGELERYQASKRAEEYTQYYEGCVSRRLDDILETYHTWLLQIHAPVATVRKRDEDSHPVFVPKKDNGELHPRWNWPRGLDGKPVTWDRNPREINKRRRRRIRINLPRKIKEMQALPNLSTPGEDLRGLPDKANMDGPANRGNGDGGVRMLDARQSKVEECGLLAPGEGIEQ